MNEEVKLTIDTLRYCEESGARCGGCPSGINEQGIPNCHSPSNIADLIESLSAQLDQVTRERDAAESNKFQYETGFIKGFEAAHPKWISVEDDIPTDDYDVLAWVGNKEIAIAWFDGYTGEWHAYGSYEGDVTHWMPMPEPPKEE